MAKKAVSLLLAVLLIAMAALPAFAAVNDGYEFDTLGEKTAEQLVLPGQYEITLSVPGAVEVSEYSEVILMLDASSSMGSKRDQTTEMIIELGEQILHNDGTVGLTLMGFGMGPKYVGTFYNVDTLRSFMANASAADFRQGVSATNCDGALQFVNEYIAGKGSLRKTAVVFMTDGNTNMDEALKFNLSAWEDHPEWWHNQYTAEMIVKEFIGSQADALVSGGDIFDATAQLFQDEAMAIELARVQHGVSSDEYKAAIDKFYYTAIGSGDKGVEYVDACIRDVYANIGYAYGDEYGYSTSELEKAFLAYKGGVFSGTYYCMIFGASQMKAYEDNYGKSTKGMHAADSADELAANGKVLELYMVGFGVGGNNWMDPDSGYEHTVTNANITYMDSGSFEIAAGLVAELGEKILTTVYKDVTVTDPMSKWVELKEGSIRIYEDDAVIWEEGSGWLIENPPVDGNPVTVETNADGRKQITWLIKEGNLLYTDRYYLKYIVDVNENAEGFIYGEEYPANDPTSVAYEDENGDEQTKNIEVPDVTENEPPADFDPEDMGFKIYKSSLYDDTPISGITFDVYHVVPEVGDVLSEQPTAEEYGKYAVEENLVASVTTDGAGYASVNLTDLGYGKGFYLFIEQNSEKVDSPVDPFYLSMPMADPATGEPMYLISIFPKNVPIEPDEPDIPPEYPPEDEEPEKGKISIIKHSSEDEQTLLAGAVFQVYRPAGADETPAMSVDLEGVQIGLVPVMNADEPVLITTDENGYGESIDLDFGLYFLVETTAPNGYDLLDAPLPAFVTASSVQTEVMIANEPGVRLPETGGTGVFRMMTLGTILIAAAVCAGVKYRRA